MPFAKGLLLTALLLLAACAPQEPVNLPTLAPTFTPVPPTSTPLPSPTPRPAVFVPQQASSAPASIRVVNTLGQSVPLNLLFGSTALATNLGGGQTTEMTRITSGEHRVFIRLSGSRLEDPPLLDTTITIPAGDNTLLVIGGSETAPTLQLASSQAALPIADGRSGLVITNTSSQEWLVTGATSDGSAIEGALPPLGSLSFAELAPGAADVSLMAGAIQRDIDLPLQANRLHTLIAADPQGSPASFSEPALTPVALRAVNASAINLVDLYLDNRPLFSALEYGRLVERREVTAALSRLTVFLPGDDPAAATPLLSLDIALPSQPHAALVLLGNREALSVVVFGEDLSPTTEDTARLVLLNTVQGNDPVQVVTQGNLSLDLPDLNFGQPSPEMNLLAGTYDFTLLGTQQNRVAVLEQASGLEFSPGIRYLVLITGQQNNTPTIISDTIGTSSTSALLASTASAGIRLLNATESRTLILRTAVEGATRDVTSEVAPQTVSTVGQAPEGLAALQLVSPTDASILATLDETLEADQDYTAVAFQTAQAGIAMFLIQEQQQIGQAEARIRLVHAVDDPALNIGLAIGPAITVSSAVPTAEPGAPEGTPSPESAVIVNSEAGITLPFDTRRIVRELSSLSASPSVVMPAGAYAIYITLGNSAGYILDLPQVELASGSQVDMVVTLDAAGDLRVWHIRKTD